MLHRANRALERQQHASETGKQLVIPAGKTPRLDIHIYIPIDITVYM